MPYKPRDDGRETVLLLGNYRPTLAVARSLSRHGYRVAVGLGGGEGCTEYSRFVSEGWDHPPLSGSGEAFLAALLTLLDARRDITIVYPVAEEFVRFLAEVAHALPRHIVVASPQAETVRTCCDKLAMFNVVSRTGIDHLPCCVARSLSELADAAQTVGFPLVVRPLNSPIRFGHKKALIARDREELARLLPCWPDGHSAVLLQRQANGERQDVFFAASAGRIMRAMQVRYRRTDHVEGTGLCVHGEVQPVEERLLGQCRMLAQALDYTGIGCAQFVVNMDTKDICFIELNPRTSAIHRVAEESGMELSLMALALAQGDVPSALAGSFSYRPGKSYAWTYGELRGIKSALREREISAVGAVRWLLHAIYTAISVDFHLTWRPDDPLPTIMLFLRQLGLPVVLPKSRAPRITSIQSLPQMRQKEA